MTTINSYVSTLGQIILLINIVLYWFGPPALRRPLRYFWYFLLWTLVIQIGAKILWFQSRNNLPLLHLYTAFEFVFLSLFYREVLQIGEENQPRFNYAVAIVFVVIALNSLLLQPLTRFNSNAKTLTQIAYIGYAVYYFFKFQGGEEQRSSGMLHLVNSGVLIYYAVSLFIFMFGNVFLQIGRSVHAFWVVNSSFYLGFQLLIFYVLWKTTFRQTRST